MNMAIRNKIKAAGVFQYQVADRLGVSEMTLIRWLRKPLPKEKEDAICAVIDGLSVRSSPSAGNDDPKGG